MIMQKQNGSGEGPVNISSGNCGGGGPGSVQTDHGLTASSFSKKFLKYLLAYPK
jgi:hypothetical protein